MTTCDITTDYLLIEQIIVFVKWFSAFVNAIHIVFGDKIMEIEYFNMDFDNAKEKKDAEHCIYGSSI